MVVAWWSLGCAEVTDRVIDIFHTHEMVHVAAQGCDQAEEEGRQLTEA